METQPFLSYAKFLKQNENKLFTIVFLKILSKLIFTKYSLFGTWYLHFNTHIVFSTKSKEPKI